MTNRGKITLASIPVVLLVIFFSYFTWSMASKIQDHDQMKSDITRIDTESDSHWKETNRRFDSLDGKVDKIWDAVSRRK